MAVLLRNLLVDDELFEQPTDFSRIEIAAVGETWDEVEPLVKKFKGAKYQGYSSRDDAEQAWQANQAAAPSFATAAGAPVVGLRARRWRASSSGVVLARASAAASIVSALFIL